MALIKCPECGKEVSDRAETCIHCGYPLKEDLEEPEEKNEEEGIDIDEEEEVDTISAAQFSTKQWTPVKEEKKKRRGRTGRTAIIIVVVVVVIVVLIAVWNYRSTSYTRAKNATKKAEQEYRDAQSNLDSLERQKSEVEAEIDAIESNR